MEQPNLSYINALSAGDELFKQNIISVVKKELPSEVLEYQNNMALKNFKGAADNVHKLKHKISILGLETTYAIAVAHEDQLRQEMHTLHADFEAVLKKMLLFIEQL